MAKDINEIFRPVVNALMDSDLIGCISFPSCYEELNDNQVIIKIANEDKRFILTMEEYKKQIRTE